MALVRLPVSGWNVVLRGLTGADDTLLLDAASCDTALALALVSRLARSATELAIEWETLPVTDLDALLLWIRQMVFGDALRADIVCPAAGCGRRFDVAFGIEAYLAHHRPRWVPGVAPIERENGWFALADGSASFRIPTGADQVVIARAPRGEQDLIRRCVRPVEIDRKSLRRVERALEAMAPVLSHEVQGICPECGATVEMLFDVQQFVLHELRGQAAFIYEDVHLLASHYRWSEADILALPRDRRARYVELIRQERSMS